MNDAITFIIGLIPTITAVLSTVISFLVLLKKSKDIVVDTKAQNNALKEKLALIAQQNIDLSEVNSELNEKLAEIQKYYVEQLALLKNEINLKLQDEVKKQEMEEELAKMNEQLQKIKEQCTELLKGE